MRKRRLKSNIIANNVNSTLLGRRAGFGYHERSLDVEYPEES
jgi:hypothetical protein